MELGSAGGIGPNVFEDVNYWAGFDHQARLFEDFPFSAATEGFADFEHASGDRPLTFARFSGALDDEGAAGVDDDGANADDGAIWVVSFQVVTS
jgi:hypothetical protein